MAMTSMQLLIERELPTLDLFRLCASRKGLFFAYVCTDQQLCVLLKINNTSSFKTDH